MSAPEQEQQVPAAVEEGDAFHMQAEAAADAAMPQNEAPVLPQQQTVQPPQQSEEHNANATATAVTVQIVNTNNAAANNHNNNSNPQPRYAATGGITLPMGTIIPGQPAPPRVGRPPPRDNSPPLAVPAAKVAGANNARTAMEGEELWSCHKCHRDNLVSKVRCGNCQAWRGGKRESYKNKQSQMYIPQIPWSCPCGNENKPNKVRCSKCQKWKGGKRMHNNEGGIASTWLYAQQLEMIEANISNKDKTSRDNAKTGNSQPEEEWTCDKCGATNQPAKVRCGSCPRWKNGKRPKHGKKELMRLMSEEMQRQGVPMNTATILAATAAAKNAGGGSIKFAWPKMQQQVQDGHWFCMGCNHLNDSKKARCGSCQRWKFGKRENMKKRNRPTPANEKKQKPTFALPSAFTAGDAAYKAMLAAAAAGEVEVEAPPAATELPVPDSQQNWLCPCGRSNLPKKTRCSTCQKWKGGKRGSLPRKPKSETGDPTAGVFAMTLPPMAKMMPNQPNIPWECAGCGNSNGYRKLRCGACQSWKNGKKQLTQRTEAVRTEAAAVARSAQQALAKPPIHEQYFDHLQKEQQQQILEQERRRRPPTLTDEDGALFSGDWDCHGCKRLVPGTKQRCPNCSCWKLGLRVNLTKRKPKPKHWVCQSCQKYNEGTRVRCHSCQGWRDGERRELKLYGPDWICERCKKENKASKARCGGCQRWKGGQRLNMRKEPIGQQRARNALESLQQHQQPTIQNQTTVNVPAQIPPNTMPLAGQPSVQVPIITATGNVPAQNQAVHALRNLVLLGQAQKVSAKEDTGANTKILDVAHPLALPDKVPMTIAGNPNVAHSPALPGKVPQAIVPGHHSIGQTHSAAKEETPDTTHPPVLPGQVLMTIAASNNMPGQHDDIQTEAPPNPSLLAQAQETTNATKTETDTNNIWTCTKCTCDNLMNDDKCKICDGLRDGWDGEDV